MLHAAPDKPETLCSDCGAPVSGLKAFCDARCRSRFHNRSSKRGRVLTPLAMAWRGKYGKHQTSKDALSEISRLLDQFNAEDREAGRPSAFAHVERLKRRPVLRWNDR